MSLGAPSLAQTIAFYKDVITLGQTIFSREKNIAGVTRHGGIAMPIKVQRG